MSPKPCHIWIVAPYQQDRQICWNVLKQEGRVYEMNCHRRLRGPYTGAGSLLRQLVPAVYQQHPEYVSKYAVEILALAPELGSFLSVFTETLTSLATFEERTRFYSRARTLRLAHGIIDFLKGCLSLGMFEHLTLYFENVHTADALDQEFLAALLRRVDPVTLMLVLGTNGEDLPPELDRALKDHARLVPVQPLARFDVLNQLRAWGVPSIWQQWVSEHTQGWLGEYGPLRNLSGQLAALTPAGDTFANGMCLLVEQVPDEVRLAWGKAYVMSDGSSDELIEILAYQALSPAIRRQWHDERAHELEQQEQCSLRLGAIPYHREHGASPADLGAAALLAAVEYCVTMGFYESAVDLGDRGLAVIDWPKQIESYWMFTTYTTTSLTALGHPEEAEQRYIEARGRSSKPTLQMQTAYLMAMLYTRYHRKEQRDYVQAKAWINQAIAFATCKPDPKDRTLHTVFYQNGLALIEYYLGHAQEALRLVTEGMERLERELEPGEHRLQRSILLSNRAQVYVGLGQLGEALADYTAVIQQDPFYSEYYFDRGNLYRQLGRNEEALADYTAAIRYSPPYLEAYYNRAGTLSVLGRDEEALSDYTAVLELDPSYLDALVNRASIFYEREAYALSRQDVEQGLQLDPENAQLLCTRGLLEMVEEHWEEAEQAFTQAIEHSPQLVAAWTNRAVLAFENGRIDAAIADLTQALVLEESAPVLYNRGIAYQAQAFWSAAIDDFTRVLALDQENVQDVLARRAFCLRQLNAGENGLPHTEGKTITLS